MQFYQYLLYGIVLLACLGGIYFLLGGRSIWSIPEAPSKIVGKKIKFHSVEGDKNVSTLPAGTVIDFSGGEYRIDFDSPVDIAGKKENSVFVCARHKGYPMSAVKKRGWMAVNGRFSSNVRFIASINIAV